MAEAEWLDAREAQLWQSYRDKHRDLMRALEARLIGNSGLSGADYALMHPLSVAEDGVEDSGYDGAYVFRVWLRQGASGGFRGINQHEDGGFLELWLRPRIAKVGFVYRRSV